MRLRDEQRRLIRTFADKEVAEELISSGFSLGGKRTPITAMFTDIRNFTTITEANDPAVVIDLINQYYLIVIKIVQAHGGNVNQLQGDGWKHWLIWRAYMANRFTCCLPRRGFMT